MTEDDLAGYERASLEQMRERIDELERQVEENQDLIQMAAHRLEALREQQSDNTDQ